MLIFGVIFVFGCKKILKSDIIFLMSFNFNKLFSVVSPEGPKCAAAKYISDIESDRNTILRMLQIRNVNDLNAPKLLSGIDRRGVTKTCLGYLTSILISIRDQNILLNIYPIIFKGDLVAYGKEAFNMASHIYERSYNELTFDANKNFKSLYKYISAMQTAESRMWQYTLLTYILYSIDNGMFTDINLQSITFISNEFKKYPHLYEQQYCQLGIIFVYKLLRFYQDLILILNLPFAREPTEETVKTKRIAEDIASKLTQFTTDLFTHFSKEIIATIPKEILRVLYDPRSYLRLKAKFEAIYKFVESQRSFSDQNCFTNTSITMHFISYRLYRHLFQVFMEIHQKNADEMMKEFNREFAPRTELYDIDLIAADISRALSQNHNFSKDSFYCAKFLQLVLNKMIRIYTDQTGSEPKPVVKGTVTFDSFINAIFTDILFCPSAVTVSRDFMRPFYVPFHIFFTNENFQSKFAEVIAQRLMNADYQSLKRRSFSTLTHIYENVMDPPNDFKQRIQAIPKSQINEKHFRELINATATVENRSIPESITNYAKSGKIINSVEGTSVLQQAAAILEPIVEEIRQSKKISQDSANIIVAIYVGMSGNTIEQVPFLFEKLPYISSFIYATKFENISPVFLTWTIRAQLYDEFNEMSTIFAKESKILENCLVAIIKENIHPWKNLVSKCALFRQSSFVLTTICFYSSISVVQDLVDEGEKYDVMNLLITAGKQNWHPDACFNLVTLLRTCFLVISDFLDNFSFFEAHLKEIPPFAMNFFENQIKLMGVSEMMMELIKKLNQANQDCAAWSKKLYGILSANRKSANPSPAMSPLSSPVLMI